MQVRVFEAQDMASGLKVIRRELGPDALILSTRTIRSGKLGLLGKPVLEITAAVDSQWPENAPPPTTEPKLKVEEKSARPHNFIKTGLLNTRVGGGEQDISYEQLSSYPETNITARTDAAEKPSFPETQNNRNLGNEVDELKNLVRNLAGELSRINASQQPATSSQRPSAEQTGAHLSARTQKGVGPVYHLLQKLGINEETAATLSRFTHESLKGEELLDHDILHSFLAETLVNLLEVQPPDFEDLTRQQRIALVGPTGVGKTTTLAKLAAHYISRYSRSIALITIDTYRIAAVEQLKVYAGIMHLPLEVVITPEQLTQALDRHKDAALILIDTAGRSPRNQDALNDLAAFFSADMQIEKHLVLSAATRETELMHTIKAFSELGIDRTIFTKIDECLNTGVILNTQLQHNSPLSYLTNGQRVPEDLLEISRRSVAELILTQQEGCNP